jgi:CDP-glucose 4,6-dehydratase
MSKVLVTGGSGLIGRFLLPQLGLAGHEVKNFDLSEGHDIMDRPHLNSVLSSDTDAVIHLAANSLVESSADNLRACFNLNVAGTLNVLAAADMAGVPKVIVATSNHVYGEVPYANEDTPLNGTDPYSVSKIAIDYITRCYGYVAVRNTNVYGPDDPHDTHIIPGTIKSILSGDPITLRSDGTPRKSYLYGSDCAAGYIHVLNHYEHFAGEAVNMVGCKPISAIELAEKIAHLAGWADPSLLIQSSEALPSEFLDDTKLRKTGWTPLFSLEDGLRETIAAFRTQHSASTQPTPVHS